MVKTDQEPSQDTHMVQVNAEQDTVSAARELCRAGGALVAAARDAGTAAELAAMFAALQAAAAGRLASLQGEARLRARFEEQRLWYKWTPGGASMLTWGLQTLPEDLWARSGMCPAERVVKLAATSKRVWGLLGRMHVSGRGIGAKGVRILAQGRSERGVEIGRVRADLPLVDDRALVLEGELDGVFDGQDVVGGGPVDVLDDGGEGGALS